MAVFLSENTFARSVGAPLDQFVFDFLEESETFASIAVISLVQDDMGLVWIGTRNGLYRYDGLRFVEYLSGVGEHGLPDNWIERLYKDGKGRVWVGPRRGLCRYDVKSDRFFSYELEGDDGAVKGILENSKGELLALAESGRLYRFDESSNDFALVLEGIPGTSKCMVADNQDRLYVGGTDGIQCIEATFELGRSYELSEAISTGPNGFIGSIGIDRMGTIWFGTNRTGAWKMDPESGAAEKLPVKSKDDVLVGSLLVDELDNVLVGTTAGLKIYRPGSEEVIVYGSNEYRKYAIREGTVYALLVDAQGSLWVGTSRGGLSVVRNGKGFSAIESSVFDPLALTKKKVTAIQVDRQSRLWAGFHNEGVDRIDFSTGEKVHFDPQQENPGDLGRGSIWDILEAEDGSMWLASNWSGFQRYDVSTGRFERYAVDENDQDAISGGDVRRIVPDGANGFWLGLHGKGLDYFDRSTSTFRHYPNLTRNWVEDLALDEAGNLWIGSSDGLSFLESGSVDFVDFSHDPENENSLSDRHVTCLMIDQRKVLWVGTVNGLCLMNADGKSFTRFGEEDGLPSSSIRSLAMAADGEVWVATSKGLARYRPETQEFDAYDRSDGLVSSEFVLRSSFLSEDGKLLFGSEKGIVSFNPKLIRDNEFIPNVLITEITLSNEKLEISGDGEGLLKQSPLVTENLILPPGSNSFGFKFSATNYIASERNQFAYKLEGFDRNWINIGNRNDCSYTNIYPGKYVFRVLASNNDGLWNEKGASIAITVLPYFWQTMWFKLLVFTLVVGLVVVVFKLRIASLARQKKILVETVEERTKILREALAEVERQKSYISDQNLELIDHRENLEELVKQRTEQLELAKNKAEESDRLKTAFLENMTHEIRTPMNAIFGFMNILKIDEVDKETREEYFRIIEENGEALIELIDDILDLAQLEAEVVEFVYTDVDIHELLLRHLSRGKELIAEKDAPVEMVFEVGEGLSSSTVIDSELERLDKVFRHLIDNAIKFTEAGKITVGYRVVENEDNFIEVFVRDTGVGVDPKKIHSIFDHFRKIRGDGSKLYRGTGLGLAIVRRILDIMGGDIVVQSTLGVGTEFLITLPIRQTSRMEEAIGKPDIA